MCKKPDTSKSGGAPSTETVVGPTYLHWSPVPWSFTSELRVSNNVGRGWSKLPKYWVVSFTDTNIWFYLETQSLCARVRHWWRGYYVYASILLGTSTTMTTPCMWHSITHNMQNCWWVKVILCLLRSKQLPCLWNYDNQWNTDFVLPVPASLVSGKWWETKDAGNQCTTYH